MKWNKYFPLFLSAMAIVAGYQSYGWPGVALAVGAVVMYYLIHFNRMMAVLKRAANHPKGYVSSAVMLNARLKPRVNLLHVMAMTNALGERISPDNVEPEIFRWTDAGGSHVTCEFVDGMLVKWELFRPPQDEAAAAEPAPPAAS